MYDNGEKIQIEKEDQCYKCEFFNKGVLCPLMEALGLGVVKLTGDTTVQNCGFYKDFRKHLKVIK